MLDAGDNLRVRIEAEEALKKLESVLLDFERMEPKFQLAKKIS